jgi:hypothetical protein
VRPRPATSRREGRRWPASSDEEPVPSRGDADLAHHPPCSGAALPECAPDGIVVRLSPAGPQPCPSELTETLGFHPPRRRHIGGRAIRSACGTILVVYVIGNPEMLDGEADPVVPKPFIQAMLRAACVAVLDRGL